MSDTNDTNDTLRRIQYAFEHEIPFNRVLGLQILELDTARALARFEMRPELIGNYVRKSLHGGVVSSVLDAAGGLLALVSHLPDEGNPRDSELTGPEGRLFRTGTVDLRVDYLLPGKGARFDVEARILRRGRRLVVCGMDLKNDENQLLAIGTGVYSVGATSPRGTVDGSETSETF